MITKKTERILKEFQQDGRLTKRQNGVLILSAELYKESTREHADQQVRRFLKLLRKRDILSVTSKDVDRYISLYEKRDTAIHNLCDMKPVFKNLLAKKLISEDPLANIGTKPFCHDDDYVPAEGIAKLMDLGTVDLDDFYNVRNRLMVLYCYDLALRRSDVLRLKNDAVRVEGQFLVVRLASPDQKGRKKPSVELRNFFPQTLTLSKAYMSLKPEDVEPTDRLFTDRNGKPMKGSGFRGAIMKTCDKLGVKTYQGKTPASHRLRHTFGTLNTDTLGLRLSIHQVATRLRHTTISLTYKLYITRNPLLSKVNHEAIVREQSLGVAELGPVRAVTVSGWLSEDVAIRELAERLTVTRSGLRKCGQTRGATKSENGNVVYSADWISSLTKEWLTKEDAMALLGIEKSALFHWISEHGIDNVRIGNVTLIRLADVLKRKNRG